MTSVYSEGLPSPSAAVKDQEQGTHTIRLYWYQLRTALAHQHPRHSSDDSHGSQDAKTPRGERVQPEISEQDNDDERRERADDGRQQEKRLHEAERISGFPPVVDVETHPELLGPE